MNTKLSTAIVAVMVVMTGSLSGVAGAQAPSEVVRYSDLDLSTATGVRTLYKRIQNAAWRVCRDITDQATGIYNARCRVAAIDAAVAQLNKPALTALHTGRSRVTRVAGPAP